MGLANPFGQCDLLGKTKTTPKPLRGLNPSPSGRGAFRKAVFEVLALDARLAEKLAKLEKKYDAQFKIEIIAIDEIGIRRRLEPFG